MSVNGFLGSLGRLSQRQKHEWSSEILEEGGPMPYLWEEKNIIQFGVVEKKLCYLDGFF
jgi:hypothetical protein